LKTSLLGLVFLMAYFWKLRGKIKIMKKICFLFFLIILPIQAQQTLNLQDCLLIAKEQNLDVESSMVEINLSKEDRKAAIGSLLPELRISSDQSYSFGSVIDPTTNNRISSDIRANQFFMDASVTLLDWSNFKRIKSSKLELERSKQSAEAMANDIAMQVVQAYLQVLFDKELIAVQNRQAEVSELQLERIKKAMDIGAEAKSSFYDAAANLARDKQKLAEAENQFKNSKLRLLLLLRMESNPDDVVFTPFQDNSLQVNDFETVFESAIRINPQIKAAKLAEQSSQAQLSADRLAALPVISAQYQYFTFYTKVLSGPGEGMDASFSDQFTNNRSQFFGIRATLPIFRKLENHVAIQKSKVRVEIARIEKEKARQQLYNNIKTTYQALDNAKLSFKAAKASLESVRESFRTASKRFENGLLNAFDFDNAKNNLANAEYEFLRSRYNLIYQQALLHFYEANTFNL
jgi:outer membrane protein